MNREQSSEVPFRKMGIGVAMWLTLLMAGLGAATAYNPYAHEIELAIEPVVSA